MLCINEYDDRPHTQNGIPKSIQAILKRKSFMKFYCTQGDILAIACNEPLPLVPLLMFSCHFCFHSLFEWKENAERVVRMW